MATPPPPDVERKGGLECYATTSEPCSARVRSLDEDFQVEEVLKEEVKASSEPFSDCYPLYRVEKRSIDTFHLEAELSSVFGGRVRYAGMKDKRALAVQYVTPVGAKTTAQRLLEGHGYRCELVGYLPRPISGSMISGNRFRITLRDCCPSVGDRVAEVLKVCDEKRMPNFFGLQRFGVRDARTSRIGRALVRCEFETAAAEILWEPRAADDQDTARARELMRDGRFDEGLGLLPSSQDTERIVARSLARNRGDYLGALRSVPLALRRFYVQAYQAYLFNRWLSARRAAALPLNGPVEGDTILRVGRDGTVRSQDGVAVSSDNRVECSDLVARGGALLAGPLVGFGTVLADGPGGDLLRGLLEEEAVQPARFALSEAPELASRGAFRPVLLPVPPMGMSTEPAAVTFRFALPKGAYATVFLREFLKAGATV